MRGIKATNEAGYPDGGDSRGDEGEVGFLHYSGGAQEEEEIRDESGGGVRIVLDSPPREVGTKGEEGMVERSSEAEGSMNFISQLSNVTEVDVSPPYLKNLHIIPSSLPRSIPIKSSSLLTTSSTSSSQSQSISSALASPFVTTFGESPSSSFSLSGFSGNQKNGKILVGGGNGNHSRARSLFSFPPQSSTVSSNSDSEEKISISMARSISVDVLTPLKESSILVENYNLSFEGGRRRFGGEWGAEESLLERKATHRRVFSLDLVPHFGGSLDRERDNERTRLLDPSERN